MNKVKIKKQAISLKDFGRNITKSERRFIDAEKKYYKIIVALRKKKRR